MLVIDFMHEVELGIWKALFTHLIRILDSAAPGGKLVAILDERYVNNTICTIIIGLSRRRFRAMSPFSGTIRRFTNNVSDMKNLAARDYEDMLQVSSLATHVRQQTHNSLSCPLLPHPADPMLLCWVSAPSQHLKISSTGIITNASSNCCIGLLSGMVSRNFECTPRRHWTIWIHSPRNMVASCGVSAISHVRSSIPRNFLVRLKPESGHSSMPVRVQRDWVQDHKQCQSPGVARL